MTIFDVGAATLIWLFVILLLYHFIGWSKIRDCYKMWLSKKYWTNYNIIEAISWGTKAIIIVPGLIFGLKLYFLYLFALITSISLIWVSQKKLLPTLVGFNTLWVWLSLMVLIRSL